MRRLWLRTGLGATLALLCACDHDHTTITSSTATIVGSGVIASQPRTVSGFTSVTVTGPLRLVLQQTGTESLVVTTDDNVLPVVQSEVRGGRLFLGFAPDTSLTRTREIVCRVTVRELRDVEASGAARLEMSDIDTAELVVRLSGAVSASAGGLATQLALEVSGASRWTAGELHSRVVTANVSGASYGFVRVSESLVADLNACRSSSISAIRGWCRGSTASASSAGLAPEG